MKGRKRVEDKNRTKTKGDRETRMAGSHPTPPVTSVNVRGPSAPTERQRSSEWIKRHSSTIGSLEETYSKYRNTFRLKVNG